MFTSGYSPDMPGHKHGNIPAGRAAVYEALRRHGHTKKSAAKIAWAGKSKAGRKRMARKAARTRKRHKR